MKRTVISVSTLWIVLALASLALGQPPAQAGGERPGRRQNPARSVTSDAAGPQQPVEQRQQYLRLQQQIEELKAVHKDLIAQLQAVHKLAVKENATETAGQIQTLIDKRQDTFQKTLRQLEDQQLRLQRAGRSQGQRTGNVGQQQSQGKRAPDFELDSFDGRTVKLSNYKNRIVVLEWVNPECPFSRYHYETAHTMADLAKKYKDQEVVWFAVNSTSHTTLEANRDFAQKHKLPYPVLDDRSGLVGKQYGARNTPHMFVIDKTGVIVYEGAIDNAPLGKSEPGAGSVNYVDKALSELLANQKVTTPVTPPYGCTVKYAGQQ